MSSQGEKSKPIKQSLKKPKLPEGRFDAPEDSTLEKEPLTSECGHTSQMLQVWFQTAAIKQIRR